MDDLIRRQALKDAMYHEAFEVDSELQKWDGGCWIRYKMFENVIDDVPSAQKKGHWIDKEICFTCSECAHDSIEGGNFCPNCGSDMRGDEDG